jgi:hypothetical protein
MGNDSCDLVRTNRALHVQFRRAILSVVGVGFVILPFMEFERENSRTAPAV